MLPFDRTPHDVTTRPTAPRRWTRVAVAIPAVALLAACVSNDEAAGEQTLTVSSTADECVVSTDTAPSGTLTFTVTNDGSDVTEFYLLAEDGLRVVSELENIAPGLTRNLVVQLAPGEYITACKPGMVGNGIRAAFTVTDSGVAVGPTGDVADQLDAAAASYVAYVKDQVDALVTGTEEFAAAYTAGDDDRARELYPAVRVHYERVEPVAESFGDLDPLLDMRETDLEEGQEWSGWHLVEKDLWPPADYAPLADRQTVAADLVAYTQDLHDQVHDPSFTLEAFQVSNGAASLLDEVATTKVTGEEEAWSHTDLWDFAANVDGARVAYQVLRDVVVSTDSDLTDELDSRFAELDQALAEYGSIETGFVTYDQLTSAQVRDLSAKVDALGEPLSTLTATLTGA